MKNFLYPKSVAIVGASKDPTKLGNLILQNLIRSGFEGRIYPVNKSGKDVLGLKTYKKVSDIPSEVDTVCLVIPANSVLKTIKDFSKKGVKGLVIITAGFKEIGEEGKKLEDDIIKIAKENNIRILGPNCLGFINNLHKTNLSFSATQPLKGNIAFLSQSGAFCTAMLDMSIPKNLGFSYFISLGNKSDINEIDLTNYFLKDNNVRVISAYLEDITDGSLFIQNYQQSKNKKPVIILKAGQTEESQKAIESHTGSIAGSIEMFKTAVGQSGIIEAKNTRELFNYMMAFSWSKPVKGKNIAIVTNAGGPGIIATDTIIKHNLNIAELSDNLKDKLKKSLPLEASVSNPIDVIGDAKADRFKEPIELLAKEKSVDVILVILTPQLVTQVEETTKLILNAIHLYDKPIVPVFLGKKNTASGLQRFYDNKIPAWDELDDAILSIKALYKYYSYIEKHCVKETNKKWKVIDKKNKGNFHKQLNKIVTQEPAIIPDSLAEKIAKEIGFNLPDQIITHNISEGLDFAEGKYPVVLKVANEIVAHKTDMKGIYLNITDPNELLNCYEKLEKDIHKLFNVKIFPFILQKQLDVKAEFFIGANRDGSAGVYKEDIPGFGHLIVFGHGGIYTEIYKDFSYVLVPSSKENILENLKKTKIYEIISGARGKEPLNLEKVLDNIFKVQELTLLYPEIISLDINPLVLTENDAVAVDIKIFAGK